MEFIGQIFIVIGITLAVIGDIMIIIQAFKTSILWGLGTLFIPIVGLVFIIIYWDKSKKYVLWILLSLLSFMIGGTLVNLS